MKLIQLLHTFLQLLISQHRPLPWQAGQADPQAELLRKVMTLLGKPIYTLALVPQLRAAGKKDIRLIQTLGGRIRVGKVSELTIPADRGEMPARLYQPKGQGPFPLLVYYHGGGWVLGSVPEVDNICRLICEEGGLCVLSIEYRMAPEAPFPAAVEDCWTALTWAANPNNADPLNADTTRLYVAGDSAGATLSAVMAFKARSAGLRLSGQLLFYPVTDMSRMDSASYDTYAEDIWLPRRNMDFFIRHYTPNPQDRISPLASPLLVEDLSGLAPAVVLTAEVDVLRDEGEAYALRLGEAGVLKAQVRALGLPHGFANLHNLVQRAELYVREGVRVLLE